MNVKYRKEMYVPEDAITGGTEDSLRLLWQGLRRVTMEIDGDEHTSLEADESWWVTKLKGEDGENASRARATRVKRSGGARSSG